MSWAEAFFWSIVSICATIVIVHALKVIDKD